MERSGAIGIDPDAQGFVCALVNGRQEFEPTEATIRNWIAQAERDAELRVGGIHGVRKRIARLMR